MDKLLPIAVFAGAIGFFLWVLVMIFGRKNEEEAEPEERPHVTRYKAIMAGEYQSGDTRLATDEETRKAFGVADGLLVGLARHDNRKFLTYAGDQHLLLMAAARAGKFVNFIAPNLLYLADRSIIVIDPKGQAAAVTARRRRELGHKVVCINPFNMHAAKPGNLEGSGVNQFGNTAALYSGAGGGWNLQGSGFNPLAALDPNSHDFVDRTMSITEALIQDSGKDSHWSDSARDILAAIIMHETIRQGRTTLGDVRTVLTMPESKRLEYVEGMTTCGFAAVEELAGRFLAQNNEINGIFSEAITQTRFLTSPLVRGCLDNDDFRFEKLKDEKITVYIIIPARYLKSQSRFLRLMVVSAIDAMMASEKKQGDNSVLFIIDEFPSLGYLSSVEMAMGLAAGYGLQLWPIIQDFNQLKGIYGDKWETFLGNAGVKIIKGANDNFTAEYVGKMSGEKSAPSESANIGEGSSVSTKEDGGSTSQSRNGGFSVSTIKKPLMTIPQLRGEWFVDHHLIIRSGTENPIGAWSQHYYKPGAWGGVFGGRFDPDPYHIGGDEKKVTLLDGHTPGPLAFWPLIPKPAAAAPQGPKKLTLEQLREIRERG